MCEHSKKPIDDFMDPLAVLKRALARPALSQFSENAEAVGPDGRRAAYQLAAAIGWCRLFGRKVDESIDGVLRWDMAEAAAKELTDRLHRWTESARSLEQRWFSTPEPLEAVQLCLGLLHLRMKAWAVQAAIDEAYVDSWADQEELPADRLEAAIGPMGDALEAFDVELCQRRNLELLCVATETTLLENWRAILVGPYADALPWWLDDTLEVVSQEVEDKAVASQPSDVTWRKLREARRRTNEQSPEDSMLENVLATSITSHLDTESDELAGVRAPGARSCPLASDVSSSMRYPQPPSPPQTNLSPFPRCPSRRLLHWRTAARCTARCSTMQKGKSLLRFVRAYSS